jgi:hypothetical protein
MSLLRRIQDATTDPNFQLADILRLSKVLAARLEYPAFKEWVSQELNGYENREQLPDYRVLNNLNCRGHFFGPAGSRFENAQIPSLSLPEDFRELLSTNHFLESVSALENTVNQANQNSKSLLRSPWSADAVAILGADIYEGMQCGQAWTDIPTSCLVTILDTIRNRVLDFVLEVEIEAPDIGEVEAVKKDLPENVVSVIFDRCILQNHQIASSGSMIYSHSGEIQMPNNYVNNLQGSNIANMANTVQDSARQQANQHIHLSEQKKTLAEAAGEIQQLLKQLEQSNPSATELEKVAYINDETTPSFKRRLCGALQATGESAIDEFVLENKYLKVAKAAVKGWMQPGS